MTDATVRSFTADELRVRNVPNVTDDTTGMSNPDATIVVYYPTHTATMAWWPNVNAWITLHVES